MSVLDELKSVLCDPKGEVCIHGSDGDRKIISDALVKVEALEEKAWMYDDLCK